MFIGEYKHNIDDKGRLAMPAKFRAMLKGGAVATKGLDNCLFVYPKNKWEEIAKKLASLPFNQLKARSLSRLMLAGAMAIDFDNQGRINLPEYLRRFASLKKKAVVAGLYDRLEIWDEAAWNKFRAGAEKDSANIAETLGGLGV